MFKGGLFVFFEINVSRSEIFHLKELNPDMKAAIVTLGIPLILQCRIMSIEARVLNFFLYVVLILQTGHLLELVHLNQENDY